MKAALISVIVPVYNVEKYLHKCINSILNQTYKNLEIILIDDGSTDNSGKICDEYALKDNRIKVIHKENGGLSSARNAGLDICSGDYIGFVDSDDYIAEDMYEYLYVNLIKNNADVAMCNYWIENNLNTEIADSSLEKFILNNKSNILKFHLEHGMFFPVWNKIFKKEIIKNIKFPIGLNAEDVFILIDWINNCNKIVFGNDCKYFYLKRETSLYNRPANKNLFDEVIAFKKIMSYINNNLEFIENVEITRKWLIESYRFSLDRILFKSNVNKFKNEKEKIINVLKRNFIFISKNRYISFKSKILYLIIIVDCKIYFYLKKKLGKSY